MTEASIALNRLSQPIASQQASMKGDGGPRERGRGGEGRERGKSRKGTYQIPPIQELLWTKTDKIISRKGKEGREEGKEKEKKRKEEEKKRKEKEEKRKEKRKLDSRLTHTIPFEQLYLVALVQSQFVGRPGFKVLYIPSTQALGRERREERGREGKKLEVRRKAKKKKREKPKENIEEKYNRK